MDTNDKHIDPVGLLPKVFSGEASSDEKRLVDDWLLADPANREEYTAFARLWNITSTASHEDPIDIDSEWQKMNSTISVAPAKTISMARVLQIAAAIILVSLLGYTGYKISGPRWKSPMDKTTALQLPDGTALTLNAGSKITYKKGFGTSHRNLTLKGEAFFEVEKGIIPFIISANEASVRVTGTSFNVKAYEDRSILKITVTEGTVSLYKTSEPQKETLLLAGETGVYDKSVKTITKLAASNPNDLSWKTRVIDFRSTPLSEVAETLSDTYHVTFNIAPALENCTVTVQFDNRDLGSVIEVLKTTLDLTIIQKDNLISITGKGC
ncbi:MAG: FecR domain-containing protein [Bacteroidales bacterium]|nr:FecR domain-containing protein [Bacteroidales bacterium]